MILKSILAFHLMPNIMSGETRIEEAELLYWQMFRRCMGLPSWTNLKMLTTLIPAEDPRTWFIRITRKALLKTRMIRPEIELTDELPKFPNTKITG